MTDSYPLYRTTGKEGIIVFRRPSAMQECIARNTHRGRPQEPGPTGRVNAKRIDNRVVLCYTDVRIDGRISVN